MAESTAIITGAGSGIGRAIALGLTELVDSIVLIGRDAAKLTPVCEEIAKRGKAAVPLCADLASEPGLSAIRHYVEHQLQGLDALVHCAGAYRRGLIGDTGTEDMDWHYAVNLRAPCALTQISLPALRWARGQIVFINSSAGLSARPELAAYCASKSALKAFADALRAEENANGVRVLSVFPGRTATPLQEKIFGLESRIYDPGLLLQPDDIAQTVVSALALPRSAEITELMIRGIQKA
jgi:NADP-dependent 3-hydroxy acid dehydrogenase YdfG